MTGPHVAILMAVWNGGAHLAPQLDSIAAQGHRNWTLIASDDGSADNSRAVLEAFGAEHPLVLLDGPGTGNGCDNFMSLIRRAGSGLPDDDEGEGSHLAFADQDDIWVEDKLARGLAALKALPADRPALYCSRTWIADADARPLRLSRPRPRPPSFRNALVQNVCSGNTILLNPAATRLVRAAAAEIDRPPVVHDWWLYQVVTGAGGRIVHDDEPGLFYRQHGVNQIGANDTTAARIKRIRQLLRGDFRDWNAVNVALLQASAHRFTPRNRARLAAFADLRDAPLGRRLRDLAALGLYRQSRSSTAALWLSAVLGRL